MALVSLGCPNCGGSIQMDNTVEKGFCMYCGSSFFVKDEVQRIQIEHSGTVEIVRKREVDNLLIRAEQKIKEYEDSDSNGCRSEDDAVLKLISDNYIEKALDIEPNHNKAIELKNRLIRARAAKQKASKDLGKRETKFTLIVALSTTIVFVLFCIYMSLR